MKYFVTVMALCSCLFVLACNKARPDGGIVFATMKGDVHFDLNSAQLSAEGLADLEKILAKRKNTDIPEGYIIQVEGHTDDTGTHAFNMTLSKQRADAVAKVLVDKGYDKARIVTKGLGPDEPLYPNDSDLNRAGNNRVELVLRPVQ